MRIGLLAIGGWLVAAVLTVGASWSAINVVRDSVVPQTPVASALPAPEGTITAAPATSRPGPAPTPAAARGVSGQGGSVTARCDGGRPRLVKVVPQQGFAAVPDDSQAEVTFTSSTHRTEVRIACSGSTVSLSAEEKAISAGGGGGDDNGGGGGGSGRGRGGGGGGKDG
jgi:hypothetical protein